MAKLYEWKCPKCNKVIHSTYKEQFDYNKEQHILAHKRNTSKPSGDGGIKKKDILYGDKDKCF